MFNANKGFFNFIFANQDDDYFTDSYVKLSFEAYIRLQLIRDDFHNICIIGAAPYHSDKDYRLRLFGSLSKSLLSDRVKSGGKRAIFGKKKPAEAEEYHFASECIDVDFSELQEYILKLLFLMSDKNKRRIAVVCPIEIFSDCCHSEGIILKAIHQRKAHFDHCIMVLTGSVDAKENNVYFRKPNAKKRSIFFNETIFPEIGRTFDEIGLPKLIFTYEMLKKAFPDRMQVLNDLSYKKLCIAVKYTLMRSERLVFAYSPECYAAVLWAWYESPDFRRRYPELNLPENPFRSLKLIINYLMQSRFLYDADSVIEQEGADPKSLVNKWFSGNKGVSIVFGDVRQNECYSNILVQLEAYRNCIAGHEQVLGQNRLQRLAEIREHFSCPSYPSSQNLGVLPHERFAEEKNRQTLKKLYSFLRKGDWNNWDEGAIYLLYVLFDLCMQHSTEIFTLEGASDEFNIIGELQFKKTMEIVNYCIRQSDENPMNSVIASSFIASAERALLSNNKDTIKSFVI